MSTTTEEQLISFFLYSLFIYPVTNYLVSAKRAYPRWKGACYAIIFLAIISTVHMLYENREKGPNHYNLLGVSRGTSTANLKRAYRTLSLELHPDKNKSPTAPEEFRKVKQAFDVLLNPDTRQVYDRLGDAGVKVSAKTVIDHKYIIIQMLVYYSSSMIFAFLMTFAESGGDAMITALFGLTVVLLVECALVLEQVKIPVWILPQHTSHDVVSLLRRLYPAFMNGCRCITGAFVVDYKSSRVEALQELIEATRASTLRASALVQSTSSSIEGLARYLSANSSSSALASPRAGEGDGGGRDGDRMRAQPSMEESLRMMMTLSTRSDTAVVTAIKERTKVVQNPSLLRSKASSKESTGGSDGGSTGHVWRNLAIYLISRFVLMAYRSKTLSSSGTGGGGGKKGGGSGAK